MEEQNAKEYFIGVVVVLGLFMLWNVMFPDNAKTEIRCTGQTCEFKEYGQDKKLKSTSIRDAHECKFYELHEQPRFSLFTSRGGKEYSVLCVHEDGRRGILFPHHIKSRSKAQRTVDALNSTVNVKEVYFNHTYSNK